jgi:hypothetical protein
VKDNFYFLSSTYSRSTFEVVLPSSHSAHSLTSHRLANQLPIALLETLNAQENDMKSVLDSLNQGDTMSFKVDNVNSLQYNGGEQKIRNLTLVASGEGIIPILQLLRRLLLGDIFDIESCGLLWINPTSDSFLFNHQFEALEKDFGKKFTVARVLDQNINSEKSQLNSKIIDSFPEVENGRVVMISANPIVKEKFMKMLKNELLYSEKDIGLINI